MPGNAVSRISATVICILAALFVAATIWLPQYIVPPKLRTATFAPSIAYACLLELLTFAYFLLLTSQRVRRHVVWSVYPAFGVTLSLYVVGGFATIFAAGAATRLYTVLLVGETLLFLLLSGALVILSAARKHEDGTMVRTH
jgi:hypothetical protein